MVTHHILLHGKHGVHTSVRDHNQHSQIKFLASLLKSEMQDLHRHAYNFIDLDGKAGFLHKRLNISQLHLQQGSFLPSAFLFDRMHNSASSKLHALLDPERPRRLVGR